MKRFFLVSLVMASIAGCTHDQTIRSTAQNENILPSSRSIASNGNVQLWVSSISSVITYDRASNHAGYSEVEIRGKVSQSDAVVNGLPTPLPQRIRLLFPTGKVNQECLQSSQSAMNAQDSFILHLFMDNTDKLAQKIEGGMSNSAFNAFVIVMNDSDFLRIGCENKRN